METLVFISYDEADLQAGHQVETIDRPGGEPRLLLDVPIKRRLSTSHCRPTVTRCSSHWLSRTGAGYRTSCPSISLGNQQ